MSERLPKDSEKSVKARLKRQAKSMSKSRPPRLQPLGDGWWLKRSKEDGADVPVLERLIGAVAYRGRQQYIQKKSGRPGKPVSSRPGQPRIVSNVNLAQRGIPQNTRVSERKQRLNSPVKDLRVGSKAIGPNVRPGINSSVTKESDDDLLSFD